MEKKIDKKERVILIKGDASKWYEQAIFIVNQNTPKDQIPLDFVAEAEKIIQNHIRKSGQSGSFGNVKNKAKSSTGNKKSNSVGIAYASAPLGTAGNSSHKVNGPNLSSKNLKSSNKSKASRKRFDYVLNTIMAVGCIVIAAVLMWGLLG